MEIEYVIEEDVDGVLNASKYAIEDSEESLKEWNKLQNEFRQEFTEFSSGADYDLTDWHNGIKCLSVYIYNERFYDKRFIPRIISILNKNRDSFAQFECYDDSEDLLGYIQIYLDKVFFDEMLQENGIVNKLYTSFDKTKLII